MLPPTVVQNAGDLTNKVAVASIAKGQFIVGDSFVLPQQVSGFSATVPKGMQAITINVDQTHGVAGFVQPGVATRQVLEMSNVSGRTLLIHAGVRLLQVVLQRCEGNAVYQGRFARQDNL